MKHGLEGQMKAQRQDEFSDISMMSIISSATAKAPPPKLSLERPKEDKGDGCQPIIHQVILKSYGPTPRPT
jgi:hypothetical protein